jgi:hypothetical protein
MRNVSDKEAHKVHGDQADELQPAFQSTKSCVRLLLAPYAESPYTQLGTGVMSGSKSSDKLAFKSLAEADCKIYPVHTPTDYIPNSAQSFNDFSKVCRHDVPLAIII